MKPDQVIRNRLAFRDTRAVFPWFTAELSARARAIALQMSDEEKSQLLSGADMWTLRPFSRYGFGATRMADCGHGVTQTAERTEPSTCYPTGIGMASTWNEDLIQRAGASLARDCDTFGVQILLGPMINLHRVPVNGRSFETFSEDPVLAGVLGGAQIRGLQNAGIGACLKAAVANNQQHQQHTTNVEADEKTIRELYLQAFEIAVQEGGPVAIMTSYNPLWGEQTAESRWLVRDHIKGEWQFPGFVVSDWRAVGSPSVYRSGLDLEMPGPGTLLGPERVLEALGSGELARDDFDDRARRMVAARLACAERLGGGEPGELNPAVVAREVAEESIVLLTNDGALPFDREELRTLAVIGPNAMETRIGGGGSASVSPPYAVSPLEGIRSLVGDDVEVVYAEGCGLLGNMQVLGDGVRHETVGADGSVTSRRGFLARFFTGDEPSGDPVWTGSVAQIDFFWGWSSPAPGVTGGRYAVEFVGAVTVRRSGEHTFSLIGQEGPMRMWIGEELVIDDWFGEEEQRNQEAQFQVRHRQVTRRFERGREVALRVHYAKRSPRAADIGISTGREWNPTSRSASGSATPASSTPLRSCRARCSGPAMGSLSLWRCGTSGQLPARRWCSSTCGRRQRRRPKCECCGISPR